MNKKTMANLIRLGVFGAAAAGLLGLRATQASADGWGSSAPAGSWAKCTQSFQQAPGTQYEALDGWSKADGVDIWAIPPVWPGTMDPASLASGKTEGQGYPNSWGAYVIAPAGGQTTSSRAQVAMFSSKCRVSGYNLL